MNEADVIVVGGGPAGSAAAINLARAGVRVVVADRARFPRDKCCGDGLTAAALRELETLGLRPDRVASWTPVIDISMRGPSGRVVDLRLPADGIHAAVATRTDLDAALLDLARQAGAVVHEEARLTGLDPAATRVEVTTEGAGTLSASYVVAADGAWSPTRKLLSRDRGGGPAARPGGGGDGGEDGYLGDWHAMRQYLTGVGPAGTGRLWVWFDPDLLPGYAWSFPLGAGRVNFGFGMPRRQGVRSGTMGSLWDSLADRPHIRAVLGRGARPAGPVRAWPIPATVDAGLLAGAGGRVLFAGDAARVTDPMTGEGIGQALASGVAAARAILTSGPEAPADAAALYRAELGRTVLSDNRLAAWLSARLDSAVGARGAVRVAGLSRWTRANFARWLFEDYPRAVVATPRRWRPGMLTPAGAYPSASMIPNGGRAG